MSDVTLVMAEFGPQRKNAGGSALPLDRLEPTLSTFRETFPECDIKLYTDNTDLLVEGVSVDVVDPPAIFDKRNRRYNWRCNDYYKIIGLQKVQTKFAIAMDADMVISNAKLFRTILPMVDKFGIAVPQPQGYIYNKQLCRYYAYFTS